MHISRPFMGEQQQKSPHPPSPRPKAFGVKPFQEAQKLLVCVPFFQGFDLVGDEARVPEIYLLRSVARKQSRQVGPAAQCRRRTHAPTCEDATPPHRIEPFISLFETHVQNPTLFSALSRSRNCHVLFWVPVWQCCTALCISGSSKIKCTKVLSTITKIIIKHIKPHAPKETLYYLFFLNCYQWNKINHFALPTQHTDKTTGFCHFLLSPVWDCCMALCACGHVCCAVRAWMRVCIKTKSISGSSTIERTNNVLGTIITFTVIIIKHIKTSHP